jgi:hypothetical protein
MPTKGALKMRPEESVDEVVVTRRSDLDLLRSELLTLRKAAGASGRSLFFSVIGEADQYLKGLESIHAR